MEQLGHMVQKETEGLRMTEEERSAMRARLREAIAQDEACRASDDTQKAPVSGSILFSLAMS